MRQLWFLIFLLLTSTRVVSAQVPKYFIRDPGSNSVYNFGLNGASPTESGRIQSIYVPSDFPGAPSGMVTHIYARGTSGGGGQPDFVIKMGYTSRTKFYTNGGTKYDTFLNLYTVFSRPGGYSIPKTDTNGTWFKFRLEEGNFYYDKTKNFAVEWAFGPPIPGNGFDLCVHHSRPQTSLAGSRSASTSRNSWSGVDFGFDLATTGVDNVTNIESFGLFPNPAIDGRFNVSFNSKQPVDDVLLTVFSVTGELVYSKSYLGGANSFFKEVNLKDVAKGTYIVKVTADGESITRSVVVP